MQNRSVFLLLDDKNGLQTALRRCNQLFLDMSTYKPTPVDTNDVALSPQLMELAEKMAENVHDVWAIARINEGWSYGPERDDRQKTNPCLVPYPQLPESEKQYDRETALTTLRLIIKMGFDIVDKDR